MTICIAIAFFIAIDLDAIHTMNIKAISVTSEVRIS